MGDISHVHEGKFYNKHGDVYIPFRVSQDDNVVEIEIGSTDKPFTEISLACGGDGQLILYAKTRLETSASRIDLGNIITGSIRK